MTALVTITDGQAVTTTLAIAAGTQVEHASVIKLVRSYQSDLEEFGLVRFEIRAREAGKHGGGDVEFAILNEQQSTLLLTYMRNSEIVRAFKKRLVKEFWQMAQQLRGQPIVPQTLPEALRLAADLAEQKQIAEAQRDHAIATKAEIGSRREATAMSTASNASKKAARLEIELDRSMQYASVKRMELAYKGVKFEWRLLKAKSQQLGLPPEDIHDSNYGTVKAYHADVWMDAYGLGVPMHPAHTRRSPPAESRP